MSAFSGVLNIPLKHLVLAVSRSARLVCVFAVVADVYTHISAVCCCVSSVVVHWTGLYDSSDSSDGIPVHRFCFVEGKQEPGGLMIACFLSSSPKRH